MSIRPVDSFERSLPHAIDAEKMILGVILLDNELLAEAAAKLQASDFYSPSHKAIWQAMTRLGTKRSGIDPLTLSTELGEDGLDRVGGAAYIASLFDGMPRLSSIESWLQLVRRAAIRRELVVASCRIADDAYEGESLAEDILATANQRLASIDAHRSMDSLVTASDAGWQRLQAIEDFQASGRAILGIGTGIHDFDRLTGGLIRGDQHLLAARPSMGKTALAVRLADGVATSRYNEEAVQVFFTAEMRTSQIMDRWLFGTARVDQMRLRTNRLNAGDYRLLQTAQQKIDTYKVVIDETSRKPSEVRAVLRRVKREFGRVDVFYFDHIGKGKPDGSVSERRHQIGNLSAEFKEIAKEFDAAGVILSQLNRLSPGTGDKKPELHHLAEGGTLEQDADMVFYPHRPGYYQPESDQTVAEIGILKQRNGPAGVTFPMIWQGSYSWFDNPAKFEDN